MTGTPSKGFDEKAYLAAKQLKAGEDPYRQHAFNQLESDKLSPDRPVRDTRHYRCGLHCASGGRKGWKGPTLVSLLSVSHLDLRNGQDFLRLNRVIETFKPSPQLFS